MKEYIEKDAARDLMEQALVDEWEIQYADDRLDEIPAADVVEYEEVENLLRWAVLHDWTWEEAQDHLQRLRAKMDGGVNDGKADS